MSSRCRLCHRQKTYELRGGSKALHDYVWADTLLYEPSDLLEHLSREKYDAGGTIPDFSVLCTSDVDEALGGRVNDLEEFEDGGAVVCDLSFTTLVDDELVHPSRTQSGSQGVCDGETGGDVGEQLRFALGCVCAFP